MLFAIEQIVGTAALRGLKGGEALENDTLQPILEEAGKFAAEVLAPLNQSGDRERAVLENGVVRTPTGFRDAYRQFAASGWNGVPFEERWGGQGLPWAVAGAVQELWQSANMGFGLCTLLTQGAVELLTAHGSQAQQQLYLPRLVSGEWTGSMNLTEPQAGSDVGALRTRAVRRDGHYQITGQKIFITYGDHDFTDNIVHMVLARTPDAPAGSRGISLFIVPKFLPTPDGRPGPRNDLRAVSLEHKLGIHASPTAVMSFGDDGGATGFLVGEENRGLEYMFTMMNNARLGVGTQGVAIAERALQQALVYARNRVQSRELGSSDPAPVAIIRHPDVRRMLMTMRALTEAARALSYSAYAALDQSQRGTDAEMRARAQARVDLLTPIVKAWSTDIGCEVASLGVQVHGGMGFIEETGAAQHYRDARIAPIYEGTNGIQANDLVFRKLARDGGAAARDFLAETTGAAEALADRPGDDARRISALLHAGARALGTATDRMVALAASDARSAAAGAAPFLRLFGAVAGGAMHARGAAAALDSLAGGAGDPRFFRARLASARCYADHVLSAAPALVHAALDGATSVLALDDASF
jgi:alkylation response protein AidB-like acyl-CoA dehydrogenase